MLERVDGINQMQQSSTVKSVKKPDNQTAEKLETNEKQNGLQENKMSSDKLKEKLEEKIDDMNKIVDTLEENLSFKLHDDTETLMTQVINLETQEVLKEMPPKEMLDLAARIHKMVGLIIDEEV